MHMLSTIVLLFVGNNDESQTTHNLCRCCYYISSHAYLLCPFSFITLIALFSKRWKDTILSLLFFGYHHLFFRCIITAGKGVLRNYEFCAYAGNEFASLYSRLEHRHEQLWPNSFMNCELFIIGKTPFKGVGR